MSRGIASKPTLVQIRQARNCQGLHVVIEVKVEQRLPSYNLLPQSHPIARFRLSRGLAIHRHYHHSSTDGCRLVEVQVRKSIRHLVQGLQPPVGA